MIHTPEVALRLHNDTSHERQWAATQHRLAAPARQARRDARRASWKARIRRLAGAVRRPALRPRHT
jgi:hypothetical protein